MESPSPSPSTSSTKRKRREDGAAARRQARPRTEEEEEVGDDATDAEVEEFYAILYRIRDASRYLAPRWKPTFSREDFASPAAGTDGGGEVTEETAAAAAAVEEEAVAENATPRCLDLNADPEPEGNGAERK